MGNFQEDGGRQELVSLLGFNESLLVREAEHYLGAEPGNMLGNKPEEPGLPEVGFGGMSPSLAPIGPELDQANMESFFEGLADMTAQKNQEEMEIRQQVEAFATSTDVGALGAVDWSRGPEALIRQFLVCGNLLA